MHDPDDIDDSGNDLTGHDLRIARKQAALELRAEGMTKNDVAAGVGVVRHTITRWIQTDPEFAARWREATHFKVDDLKSEALRRAMAGSDKLLMFMLCNLAPDQFSQTQKIEHSGAIQMAQAILAARRRVQGQAGDDCPLT